MIADDICESKHKGNQMSFLANLDVSEQKSDARDAILKCLMKVSDATSDEIVVATGIGIQTVSARMTELKKSGLITKGVRRTTRTGSTAQAWKLRGGAQ